MDKFFGIFLFTFSFSVSPLQGILCPSFNNLETVLIDLQLSPYCVVEVKTDEIEAGFEPIQDFERYCNKHFFSHIDWPRDIFVDPLGILKQKNSTYYMGYKAVDVDINAETITAISGGILRVDHLHWDTRMGNESTVTFKDILKATKYYQGIPEQLCLVGLSKDLLKNSVTEFGVLWERCTIRKTDVFYCRAQTINRENVDSDENEEDIDEKFVCTTGYVGRYCQIEVDSCLNKYCSGNGQCFAGNDKAYCRCLSGKEGPYCERTVHACSNVNCNNRGTCEVKNFLPVCNCTDEMYEGAFCERRVSNKHLFEEVNIMNFQSMS
ncbi:Sushi, nidogen and EGF-like domain-containing protein 1 [Trichinella sp. T6]|nr:Sushi, nidogen and EGF-like domain-containing protein 1 [Trichinella sp. T6]